MKTTDLDRLATLAPVNRGAALGLTNRGQGWDAPRRALNHETRWDAPPPMRPVPPDTVDLTGRVFGRATVVGMLDSAALGLSTKYGSRWVMRCSCGAYEARKAKTFTAPHAERARSMCSACDYLEDGLKGGGALTDEAVAKRKAREARRAAQETRR